jgi:hypothetical protein
LQNSGVVSRDAFYLSFAEGSRPLTALHEALIADQSVQRSNLRAAAPQPQPHRAAAVISTAPSASASASASASVSTASAPSRASSSSAGLDTDLKLCADNVQELVGYVHSQFRLLVLDDVQFCDEPESFVAALIQAVMSVNERCATAALTAAASAAASASASSSAAASAPPPLALSVLIGSRTALPEALSTRCVRIPAPPLTLPEAKVRVVCCWRLSCRRLSFVHTALISGAVLLVLSIATARRAVRLSQHQSVCAGVTAR